MHSRTSRGSRRQGKTTCPAPNTPSLQEVWGGCSSTSRAPTYSGELARVPGVHLQEDHPLRRLLTNVGIRTSTLTSPHYLLHRLRGHTRQGLKCKLCRYVGPFLCITQSSSIFLLQDECPPRLPGKGGKIKCRLRNCVIYTSIFTF